MMLMTKKRHKLEMDMLQAKLKTDHDARLACIEARRVEDLKMMREFMERVKLYRIRHGQPIGADGKSHTYTVATEISMEMMHYGIGGSKRIAQMVAHQIGLDIELALIALCHLDQPPMVWLGD